MLLWNGMWASQSICTFPLSQEFILAGGERIVKQADSKGLWSPSKATLFLFHCTMKARDEFQNLFPNTSPSAFPGQSPKHAWVIALPQGRKGPTTSDTDAPVSPGRSIPQNLISILRVKALIIHAGLPTEGTPDGVLRHTCPVAVLTVHCEGAQAALTAALTGQSVPVQEGWTWPQEISKQGRLIQVHIFQIWGVPCISMQQALFL